jgi:hypothetical protein
MYQLTDGSTIKRLSDGAFIPADLGNEDYRDYLSWIGQGNTPSPAKVTDVDMRMAARHQVIEALTDLAMGEENKSLGQLMQEVRGKIRG